MKKILLTCVLAVLLFGCKSKSATNTRVDHKSQEMMKGNWIVSSVTYPGSDVIKVNSFGLADSQCFVGSTWKLIANNNKGEMALSKADCPSFSSPITWFLDKDGQFVLKVLNAGEKARKVRDGYVLPVANQTENSFQLIDQMQVGGKTTNIVYQFSKQ
ncbi:MAG TPA: hypothetical protein VF581_06090 [Flavobacterium sp.]|jgi:hypothetical protein